ncbi:MAG: peptidase [Alphaproteobacteria bacterium]|nr:peptidase [Alphaproteobacteria bacterium]
MPEKLPKTETSVPALIQGVGLSFGLGLGHAFWHHIGQTSSFKKETTTNKEKNRLNKAFLSLQKEIDTLFSDAADQLPNESHQILEIYRHLAADKGWKRRLFMEIEKGLLAEDAIQNILSQFKAIYEPDPFWKTRFHDLEDLSARLHKHLMQKSPKVLPLDAPQPLVVIAKSLGVADFLEYHNKNLKGVILTETNESSHMIILARSLGIPVVEGDENTLKKIAHNHPLLVDGEAGQIHIRSLENLIQIFNEKTNNRTVISSFKSRKYKNLTTQDGVKIDLYINANLTEDLVGLDHSIIKGVGLYRTEIAFMKRDNAPSVETQTNLYRQVLDAAGEKPVLFRTLDIGGDKIIPQFQSINQPHKTKNIQNWRAIRLTLDRPMIMRQQLRALIKARTSSKFPEHPLYLMIPMLAEPSEFIATRQLVELELSREKRIGHPIPIDVKVGAMIEIPALVHQLGSLAPLVDFLAIGSNDLFQFFYAIDRDHLQTFHRYDVLSPAFLMFLKHIQEQAELYNIPLSLCGEMASHPLEAMALLGLGLRKLSVSPGSIEPIKKMVSSLNLKSFNPYLMAICQQMVTPTTLTEMRFGASTSLRQKLKNYAIDHGVI